MTEAEDVNFHDMAFFELVGLDGLPARGSLESASGLKARQGDYETNLVAQVETAWMTPFCVLTCAQVRTLVVQKMGLEWLGRPAIAFAAAYPVARILNYPGEMGVNCMRAAEEMNRFAQPEFSAWLAGDFGWIEEAFDWDPKFAREVRASLEAARALVA